MPSRPQRSRSTYLTRVQNSCSTSGATVTRDGPTDLRLLTPSRLCTMCSCTSTRLPSPPIRSRPPAARPGIFRHAVSKDGTQQLQDGWSSNYFLQATVELAHVSIFWLRYLSNNTTNIMNLDLTCFLLWLYLTCWAAQLY